MNYKIDLHTHSTNSPDGGISEKQYEKILNDKKLDYVAITDHNSISLAKKLNTKFAQKVIIGEEIKTHDGEIIGLFLTKVVEPDMSAEDTIKAIQKQGGLVYIPHPFETVRSGIQKHVLDQYINDVDIIEVFNGRAVVQNKGPKAVKWSVINKKAGAASSDAHGIRGLGTVYMVISDKPTKANLVSLLQKSKKVTKRPPLRSLFLPKLNKMRKKR